MSPPQVVIVGAGFVGSAIAHALKQQSIFPTIYTRNAKLKLGCEGLTVQVIDYNDQEGIREAFAAIEPSIVVSTIPAGIASTQARIADAAKSSGARLFIPSEFGMDTRPDTSGKSTHPAKHEVQQHLLEIGLPSLLIFTGVIADNAYLYYGWQLDTGRVSVVGEGKSKSSWTSSADVGRFVAYLVANYSVEELENTVHRVDGEERSQLDALELYEEVEGVKLNIAHIAPEEAIERIAADPTLSNFWVTFPFRYGLATERGKLLSRPSTVSLFNTDQFHVRPKTVREIMSRWP